MRRIPLILAACAAGVLVGAVSCTPMTATADPTPDPVASPVVTATPYPAPVEFRVTPGGCGWVGTPPPTAEPGSTPDPLAPRPDDRTVSAFLALSVNWPGETFTLTVNERRIPAHSGAPVHEGLYRGSIPVEPGTYRVVLGTATNSEVQISEVDVPACSTPTPAPTTPGESPTSVPTADPSVSPTTDPDPTVADSPAPADKDRSGGLAATGV